MEADEKVKYNKYEADPEQCHIKVGENCRDCGDLACQVCPGQVFQKGPNGEMLILYHQCLECGGCAYLCPQGNISFTYPRGGYGIIHRYG